MKIQKKRILCMLLVVLIACNALPMQILAAGLERELEYVPEVEMNDVILEENVFYFASTAAQISENSGKSHVIRIGRGGDCSETASVLVKIGDFSAHYGEDYTVALLNGAKADEPDDMMSLTDLMTGEYEAGAIATEEELQAELEHNDEFREEAVDAVNEAVGFIEDKANLAPAEETGALTLPEIEAEAEKVYSSPLQQAYAESTGIYADRQKVTSDGTTEEMQQMQDIANLINELTVGASLAVDFAAGEDSRYIVVTPKNNGKAQGDRYFYLSLTEPEGATVSSSASCAVTILDDEEVGPCEVSFNGYEISEDGSSVIVYIVRSGGLNQITDVTLRTTGVGTAVMGQDYSPVESSVLFPVSVPEMQLEIPINTANFSGKRSFELKLEACANAEIVDETLTVGLNGNAALKGGLLGDTLTARSLGSVSLDNSCAIKDMSKVHPILDHSSNYDGNNKYDSGEKAWRLEWICDWFWTDGNVSAAFDYAPMLYYSGAQVNMNKKGTCAHLCVGFGNTLNCENSDTSTSTAGMANVYDSNSSFKGDIDFFDPRDVDRYNMWDYAYVKIRNESHCSDCNIFYVYSITPIYRWFDFTVNAKETPTFLTAQGTYEPIEGLDTVTVYGSTTEMPNRILAHLDDSLAVGLKDDGKYLTLKNITDGVGTPKTLTENAAGSYTWKITDDFLDNMMWDNTLKFAQNTLQTNKNNTHPYYGYATLYAEFEHKPATVKINGAEGYQAGTLTLSGTKRGAGTYTYNKGDVIRITCDDCDEAYNFRGVKVRAKINATDTNYLDTVTVWADGGDVYLDQCMEHRLQCEYYEITPLFEEKTNGITIRVKEADAVRYLDMNYGIFQDTQSCDYKSVVIDGETYRDYKMTDITAGKIYSIPVKTLKPSYCPIWQTVDGTKYGGNVFYFEPTRNPDKNIITLSLQYSASGFEECHITGTIQRYEYNASTYYTGTVLRPFEGAMVVCGAAKPQTDPDGNLIDAAAVSVTDQDGKYSVPVNVPLDVSVRYLVSYNGNTILRESRINQTTVTDNMILNPENGTLLSSLRIDFGTGGAAGKIIPLTGGISELTVSDQGGVPYRKTVCNENGLFVEVDAVERMTGLTAVIRGADGSVRVSYKATEKNGVFVVDISHEEIASGDVLYLKVTSDRAPTGLTDENGDPVDPELPATTEYHEILSGYSFASSAMETVPTYTKFNNIPDMQFVELPMINEIGYYCNFPYVHVNIEKRSDTEYLMSVGVSVMDIVDAAKNTHINSYNNGGMYDDFLETDTSSLFNKWGSGMKNSANLIKAMTDSAKEGINSVSSLGGTSWRFNVAVGAYIKFELLEAGPTSTTFYMTGVGGYIGVQGGFRWNVYWAMPVVCIPMYFGVQAEVMINGFFGASVDPKMLKDPVTLEQASRSTMETGDLECFDSSVKMLFTGSVYLGVGICGTLGVRGGGQVYIMGLWQPSEIYDDWGADIVFRAGVWLDLFVTTIPILYSFPDIRFGSLKQIANQPLKLMAGTDDSSVGEMQFRAPYTNEASRWFGNRPYVQSGFNQVNIQTLVVNPYEHPEAQLCELSDGKILMAYIDSSGGTEATSRTTLKLSVYNGTQWSTPVEVQSDGTSDFQPRLIAMSDGKALLAWVSGAPGSEDIESITEYLASLEIYTAVIDTTKTDVVSELTRLTEDEYYDSNPVCVYDAKSDEYAVFYVKADPYKNDGTAEFKTPDALVNPYTNDSVVAYMIHANPDGRGARWLTKEYFDTENALSSDWNGQRFLAAPIENLDIYSPAIADLTAAVCDGKAIFAYTIDADSDNDTDNDKELYIQIYDFSTHKMDTPIRLSQDTVSDVLPQLVCSTDDSGNTSVTLFWYRDGSRIAYLPVSRLLETGIGSGGSIDVTSKLGDAAETKDDSLERLYSYVVPSGVSDDKPFGSSDFKVVVDGENNEDIYVVWTQVPELEEGDTDCVELYATAYLGSGETIPDGEGKYKGTDWARPYRLSFSKQYIDEPAVAITSDGNMVAVYNQYLQEITDDPSHPVLISDLMLVASILEPCGAVDVEEITLSDETPVPGDTVELTIVTENNGLTFADGYTMDVYTLKGSTPTLLTTINRDLAMRPGATATEIVSWTVPDDLSGISFLTETKENGGNWANTSIFRTEPLVAAADYEISEITVWQTEEGMMLGFTAENTGNAKSTDADIFRVTQTGPFNNDCGLADDEHTFAEVSLAGIAPGETKEYEVLVNAPIHCFEKFGYVVCYANVVKDGADEMGKSVTVRPIKPLAVYLNGEDVPEKITMDNGEVLPIEATTVPNASAEIVFTSSDENVVTFENGRLVAKNPGTATIQGVLMPSGIILEPIIVTVKQDKHGDHTQPDKEEESPDPNTGENPGSETDQNPFNDVHEKDYFFDAVMWAVRNDITSGTTETTFSPYASCTRAQVVTFLWRAAGSPEPAETATNFTDVELDSYYGKAVLWAVENGITCGTSDTTFNPDAIVNRGQMVTFLYRYAKAAGYEEKVPFGDVQRGAYYYDAVAWAYENGIAKGTSDTTFTPGNNCTRGQVVTFIYRYFIDLAN